MSTSATTKCQHCGQEHIGVRCPSVKAIEYYPDGMIKRVEYMTPMDYHPISAQVLGPAKSINPAEQWRDALRLLDEAADEIVTHQSCAEGEFWFGSSKADEIRGFLESVLDAKKR